jgi:hypothetical protein
MGTIEREQCFHVARGIILQSHKVFSIIPIKLHRSAPDFIRRGADDVDSVDIHPRISPFISMQSKEVPQDSPHLKHQQPHPNLQHPFPNFGQNINNSY